MLTEYVIESSYWELYPPDEITDALLRLLRDDSGVNIQLLTLDRIGVRLCR